MRTSVFATGGEFHLPVSTSDRGAWRRTVKLNGPLDLEAGLDFLDGVLVVRSIGLGSTSAPQPRCWRVDALRVLRQSEFLNDPVTQIGPPSRRSDEEMLGVRPGGVQPETRTHLSTCRGSPADSNACLYRVQKPSRALWRGPTAHWKGGCRSLRARQACRKGRVGGILLNVFGGPTNGDSR